jgi:hypothetical protein
MDHIFAGIEAIERAFEDLSLEEQTRVNHIESALAAISLHEAPVSAPEIEVAFVAAPAPEIIEHERSVLNPSAVAERQQAVDDIYGEIAA